MRVTRLDRAQPYALSMFRFVVGLLLTCHGAASLFGVLGRPMLSADSWPGWYAAVTRPAGGILVALGRGTRTAAFLGSGSMPFAYFDVHQQAGLLPMQNGGEAAVLFCWTLLLLVFTGPGVPAVDRLPLFRGATRESTRPQREQHPGAPA
ncbi:DoxX family protein [Streptomyces sp. NBC_00236]|uniref:DoxX family protein n=1 Tax=unclassified Streptomyces TaxID=2593676 RepID=UPI002E2D5C50|nr:DoxX family protein [Streptomyces sp. NBC_00236]